MTNEGCAISNTVRNYTRFFDSLGDPRVRALLDFFSSLLDSLLICRGLEVKKCEA